MLDGLKKWWRDRRPRPLDELLEVRFDDHEVEVRVLEGMEAGWNQSFQWQEIVRVCFTDGGLYDSDIIAVYLSGKDKPAVVLTEAAGGDAFFGALCGRGHFPDAVMRKAIGETGGATYCWPSVPEDADVQPRESSR